MILNEVTEALWHCLGQEVLKPPTEEMWLQIAEGFKQQWNFPNCIGMLLQITHCLVRKKIFNLKFKSVDTRSCHENFF